MCKVRFQLRALVGVRAALVPISLGPFCIFAFFHFISLFFIFSFFHLIPFFFHFVIF